MAYVTEDIPLPPKLDGIPVVKYKSGRFVGVTKVINLKLEKVRINELLDKTHTLLGKEAYKEVWVDSKRFCEGWKDTLWPYILWKKVKRDTLLKKH